MAPKRKQEVGGGGDGRGTPRDGVPADTTLRFETSAVPRAAGAGVDALAPRTSLGALYPAAEVAGLRAWLARAEPGPALATAAPGSGLTTIVRLLVAEAGVDAVWIGYGTERLRPLLRAAGASAVSVTMRRKVVVVDEFDAFGAGGESSPASEVLAWVRGEARVPVLVLSHDSRSQKAHEYARAWPRFAMGRPSNAAVAARIRELVPAVSEADAAGLAARARGDVRAALASAGFGAEICPPAAAARDVVSSFMKDDAPDALDVMEAVLDGEFPRDVRELLRAFSADPGALPAGLHENYPQGAGVSLGACVAASEAFSAADAVDSKIYARQAWDLWEPYGALAVAAPALALYPDGAPAAEKKQAVTKFGTQWSKASNARTKEKLLRALVETFRAAGLSDPSQEVDLEYRRAMLASCTEDDDATRRVLWPLDAPDQVAALARLGRDRAWYRPARFKKLLSAPPESAAKKPRKARAAAAAV